MRQAYTLLASVSWQARAFTLVCGLALCLWTLTRLKNRALLLSICLLFIAIGLGLISFSAVPALFDYTAESIGIQYPPLAYVMITIVLLMIVIVALATKVSTLDERCRRLAQELALRREHDSQSSLK